MLARTLPILCSQLLALSVLLGACTGGGGSAPAHPRHPTPTRKHMSSSTAKAADYLAEFHTQRDPDLLEAAADQLQVLAVSQEPNLERRRALRHDVLEQWLTLFATIDSVVDPSFDPNDLPMVNTSPPPVGGVRYPPGVSPSVIVDPVARQEYERRIAENHRKIESYYLQTKLRRLDEQLQPRLDDFVRATYAADDTDRRELEAAIYSVISNPHRAEQLRRIMVPGP